MPNRDPHGPGSSHGPITPLLILIFMALFIPATLLAFVAFMASWQAR